MSKVGRRQLVGGLLAAFAACGAVATSIDASADSGSGVTNAGAELHGGVISAPGREQMAAFPVLGGVLPSVEGAPTDAAIAGREVAEDASLLGLLTTPEDEWQVNPGLAVKVGDLSGASLYLVPGAGRICMLEVGSGAAGARGVGCTPDGIADTRGMFIATTKFTPSDGIAASTVRGVLPAGATHAVALTESGQTVPIVTNESNAYSVSAASLITSYSFIDARGEIERLVVGGRVHPAATP